MSCRCTWKSIRRWRCQFECHYAHHVLQLRRELPDKTSDSVLSVDELFFSERGVVQLGKEDETYLLTFCCLLSLSLQDRSLAR